MLLQERVRTATLLRRLPDTMTSRQARWAPPAAPEVAPRRAWIRSRWPDWVGPAAAAWSLGYGLLGLHWTLGGAGFPFGTEHDPHAARVSILEHIQQQIWLAGAALATLEVGGATLTLGLVQRWGEVYPHWISFLGGRPVRPRTAILPASLVAVLMTSAGLGHWRAAVLGYFPEGSTGENWGTVAPGYLLPLWGVALGAATLGYHLRRRGRCLYCGRPDPSGR